MKCEFCDKEAQTTGAYQCVAYCHDCAEDGEYAEAEYIKTLKQNKKIENGWQNKWKEILENPDGSINVEQLKKELSDFDDLIDRMSTLTCFITRDRLSYPTYPVRTLIGVMEEIQEEERELQKREDSEDGSCSLCDREFEEKS